MMFLFRKPDFKYYIWLPPKLAIKLPNLKLLCLLSVIFTYSYSQGQVCTGSLGDPVVNVTFGVGPNPGKPVAATSTNYKNLAGDCPNDGIYSVLNSTVSCHSSTWHTVSEDHTPNDVNGYMMVVNASYQPGDFYVDTVKGLCGNTVYEFAAWILNVLTPLSCSGKGIKPNLTFRIETTTGSKLASYDTGDILESSSPTWNQYGTFFTTPAGVSDIVLRLINNAGGGCGNDLILDDITFRPCGPMVHAAINVNGAPSTVAVCEGDQMLFNLSASVSAGFTNPSLQWQVSVDGKKWTDIPGAVTTSYNRRPTGVGNFDYRLSVSEAGNISVPSCRVVSNLLSVRVNPKPVIVVSAATPACEGAPLALKATGGAKYDWSGPNGFIATVANPPGIATSASSGKYLVTVTTAEGCVKADSISLVVFPTTAVQVGADETVCEGIPVTLGATPGYTYLWAPSKGLSSASIANPVAKPIDSTAYVLTAKDRNGCTSTDTQMVNILKKPVADAGPEVSIYLGQSVKLKSAVKGTNVSFHWTPIAFMNNSNTPTPTVSPTNNITYTLFVESNVGCGKTQDEVLVRVIKKVSVPNAFSPNGDGINDVWEIKELQNFPLAAVTVFNRYGQEVFRSKGYARSWDGSYNGKPLPTANYYYTIDLKTGVVLTGAVLILR